MLTKLIIYLRGLGLTFLAILVFSAVGWINIGSPFEASKIVIPFLMGVTIWTAMYILSHVVWVLLLIFAGCTFGIGFFIGLGLIGYVALRLTAYVLPGGWVTFTDDDSLFFLMGGSIALIDIVADTETHYKIRINTSSRDEDDDDED